MDPEELQRLKALGFAPEAGTEDLRGAKTEADEPPPGFTVERVAANAPATVVDLADPSGRGQTATAGYPDWVPPSIARVLERGYQGMGGLGTERAGQAALSQAFRATQRDPGSLRGPQGAYGEQAAVGTHPALAAAGSFLGSIPQMEALPVGLIPGLSGATTAGGRLVQSAGQGAVIGGLQAHDLEDVPEAAAGGALVGGGLHMGAESLGGLFRALGRAPEAIADRFSTRGNRQQAADALRLRAAGTQGPALNRIRGLGQAEPAGRPVEPPAPLLPENTIPNERTMRLDNPRETGADLLAQDRQAQARESDAAATLRRDQEAAGQQRVDEREAETALSGQTHVTPADRFREAVATGRPGERTEVRPMGRTESGERFVDPTHPERNAERFAEVQAELEQIAREREDMGREDTHPYRTAPAEMPGEPTTPDAEPVQPEEPERQPVPPTPGERPSRLHEMAEEVRNSGVQSFGRGLRKQAELARGESDRAGGRIGSLLDDLARARGGAAVTDEDIFRQVAGSDAAQDILQSPDEGVARAGRGQLRIVGRMLDRGRGRLTPEQYRTTTRSLSDNAAYDRSQPEPPKARAARATRRALVDAASGALAETSGPEAAREAARARARFGAMEHVAEHAERRANTEGANRQLRPSDAMAFLAGGGIGAAGGHPVTGAMSGILAALGQRAYRANEHLLGARALEETLGYTRPGTGLGLRRAANTAGDTVAQAGRGFINRLTSRTAARREIAAKHRRRELDMGHRTQR